MIKATAFAADGQTLILLGLEEGNVAKLREGKPIIVKSSELNLLGNFEIMICYEVTADKLLARLRPYIGEKTLVHDWRDKHGEKN